MQPGYDILGGRWAISARLSGDGQLLALIRRRVIRMVTAGGAPPATTLATPRGLAQSGSCLDADGESWGLFLGIRPVEDAPWAAGTERECGCAVQCIQER